jgi:hypothetical protein
LASDAGRPLAVVAVVGALPENWAGPAAVIGNSVPQPPVPETEREPELETQTDTEASKQEHPQETPVLQRTAK